MNLSRKTTLVETITLLPLHKHTTRRSFNLSLDTNIHGFRSDVLEPPMATYQCVYLYKLNSPKWTDQPLIYVSFCDLPTQSLWIIS